ncbi:MAG: electron transporter RnfE [Firmicutes bacterium GWF2_51_9]|nr:MAG: electron transporter RnfE [Firmicutes bacterium GWF2_51_9]OGS59225.1 MAG: electron transporter RnfE [Firmicutes bacterium GWE2_51_13]HAM64090.1 electron transporter RnfE [Erysipelotrichaceae bacterium]HAO60368.1 electron transporter RnfE [Erysipelotrichaceae bacterium]HBZ41789.1 electron transporter RnfE [Erysipelotrichaceae bacterium]
MKKFFTGLILDNPVFGLFLGICSTLAITINLNNALGMGISVILILIASNVIISAIRKITPDEIRIPVYIVVIATLVKAVELLIKAYAPAIDVALGVFIPLIVVNCIILGRAEAFASKNGILASAWDGFTMGLGYIIGLVAMSLIREILATGIVEMVNPFNDALIFSIRLVPAEFSISMFSQPVGAFLTFAVLAAGVAAVRDKVEAQTKKEAK